MVPFSSKELLALSLALILWFLPWQSRAQAANVYIEEANKSPIKIELLTVVPGREIYNAWGHTALRITGKSDGRAIVFDYGTFTFDRYFLVRFLGGDPMYYLAVRSWEQTLDYYKRGERTIYSQEIYLSPESVKALVGFLRWNLQAANRAYKYNHYLANCTTIYRDLLDRHLNGQFKTFATGSRPAETFRNTSLEYVRRMPLFFHGIDLIINGAADRQITRIEKMYLPDALMQELELFRKSGLPESGRLGPVQTLYAPEISPDYGTGIVTTILCCSLFAFIFLLPLLLKNERWQKISLLIWTLFASFCGLVLALLWILNSDGFFDHNVNLLVLHPGWIFFKQVRHLCQKIWQRPHVAHLFFAIPLLLALIFKIAGVFIQHIDIFLFMAFIAQFFLYLADYQRSTFRT